VTARQTSCSTCHRLSPFAPPPPPPNPTPPTPNPHAPNPNRSAYVVKNFLPIAFFIALTIALAAPKPGAAVMKPEVQGVRVVAFINSCIVFLVSGLTLRTAELKGMFWGKGGLATYYGIAAIVGITPLMAWALRELPFEPQEFSTGLAIFALMPTTVGFAGLGLILGALVWEGGWFGKGVVWSVVMALIETTQRDCLFDRLLHC